MKKIENKKALVKKYNREETLERITRRTQFPFDLEYNLKIIGEELLPKYNSGNKAEEKEAAKELTNKVMEVLRSLESEHFVGLMEAVSEQYRSPAKELAAQIIKDYECKTSIEKILASNVAHSYIKVLDNSRRLNNELNCKEITGNRTAYIAVLSKQTDRANRQLLSALMTLKQLKAPVIEMNIKAQTAFVAQNQQVNASKSNEINEAK